MTLNLNKLFHLSIRGKLTIAFVGLSLSPILIIGISGIYSNTKTLQRIAIEELNHDVFSVKQSVDNLFRTIEEDIRFLRTVYFEDSGTSVGLHPGISSAGDPARRVAKLILAFVEQKRLYYQIKFFNARGDAVFGIRKEGAGYQILTERELQRSTHGLYWTLAAEVAPEQVVFIPVELVQRDPSLRLIPAISGVYPVFDGAQSRGLIVVSVFARHFFEIIQQAAPHARPGAVMVVGREGHYLYHSIKKRDWNRLLATQTTDNLFLDFPPAVAKEILSGGEGVTSQAPEQIVSYATLFASRGSLGNAYTIVKSAPKDQIFAPVRSYQRFFIAFVLVFVVVAFGLGLLATHQFTGPINKLRRGAEFIAQGNYDARLQVETSDEIEMLAEQFNIMARSLQERDREIQQHRQHLEQTVRDRTRELEEEKNKLQVILDNVPSGFILLDKEFRIQTASAAMTKIAGRPLAELRGRRCYDVVWNGRKCSDCVTERALASGRMETMMVERPLPDGGKAFLEHRSVPIFKDRRIEAVLEIITDVTESKQLEERLIRSEKLATTGEIAAIIAHEMRNSLTAVKMILQLQRKSKRASRYDRESLDVALDSIHLMERVVNNLLRLARPAPPNKRPGSINAVILESIELTRPQIEQQGITLVTELDDHLPELKFDPDHFQEVVVNLLLNALQSMEGEGTITVRTRCLHLDKEYRDYSEMTQGVEETAEAPFAGARSVEEVILPPGQKIARVDVEDTGCGIPETALNRVFDPFFTTKTSGSGLGLSFVKRVVNEHGGVVTVDSRVGSGTRFSLLLPYQT